MNASQKVEKPQPSVRSPQVIVLSYNNVGNFGDRLGYHQINQIIPPSCQVRHLNFTNFAQYTGPMDLLVLGIGNSLMKELLTPELMGFVARAGKSVGIFGTQFRERIDREVMRALISKLSHWFARHETDLELFGAGHHNVSWLGDWLVDSFPMAQALEDKVLIVGNEIWQDLPLDRTIQRIQQHKKVLSTRVHPLLCALTSAEQVAYAEQRQDGLDSGKFASMLVDIFGKSTPENVFFPVDRAAVSNYKLRVRKQVRHLEVYLSELMAVETRSAKPIGPSGQ